MQPSKKYAIEAMYEGDDPPWEGWALIRMYPTAEARDKDLIRLKKNLSTDWHYRIKTKR